MKTYLTLLAFLFALNVVSAQENFYASSPSWKVGDKFILTQKDSVWSKSPEGEIKIEKDEETYDLKISNITTDGFIIETLISNPLDVYDESLINMESQSEESFETQKMPKTLTISLGISKDFKEKRVLSLDKLKNELEKKKASLLEQYADDPESLESMSSIYNEVVNLGTQEDVILNQIQTVTHFLLFQYNSTFKSNIDTVITMDKKPNPFGSGEEMEVKLKKYIYSTTPLIIREEVEFDQKVFVDLKERIKLLNELSGNQTKIDDNAPTSMKSYIIGYLNTANSLIDRFEGVAKMDLMGGNLHSISFINIKKQGN